MAEALAVVSVVSCGFQLQSLASSKRLPIQATTQKLQLPQEEDSWRKKARKAFSSLHQDAKVNKITTILRTHIQSLTNCLVTTLSTLQAANVPFRRDRDFVHREILSEIQSKCSRPASRVALVGLGGVGKSQLAIEYSYQVRESSPDMWVFWVHASSAARFQEGYREIAERSMKAKLAIIVTRLHCQDLSEYLPQSQNGSVLVTSRSRDVAFRITGDTRDIIPVDPMNERVAVDLLRKRLPGDFNENDAKRLLHVLDYMPLAITQAAAFISQRSPHTTLSKYLQDLQKSDADRARLLNKHVTDTRRDGKASNSIIATWQISQGIPKSLLSGRYQESNEIEDDCEDNFEDDIYTVCSYSPIGTNTDATEFEIVYSSRQSHS
ncbi:P-loop containing nucleoside triphosphate hydrolase protein [Elaphomyces granulatus]